MGKIQASGKRTKKDVIISAAAALFRQKGFSSSSMRELADAIGVEASSLYNHIGSKSEMLQTICFKVAGQFRDQLIEVEKMNAPALAKLETLIRFHIHMMLHAYDEVFVANHEWKQLSEPDLSLFLQQRKQYEHTLIEIVKEGIEKRELRPIHPYVAVLTILSAVRGLEFWHRQKQDVMHDQLEDDMVTHLLKGLIS